MKNGRFIASEIVTYRLSNSTKSVSFDKIEDAVNHVQSQRNLHPRSKKFDASIFDSKNKVRESAWYLQGLIERNELPESWN